MSLGAAAATGVSDGFPRVSGDEPSREDVVDGQPVFSPRERG